jgi:hypothetical protein
MAGLNMTLIYPKSNLTASKLIFREYDIDLITTRVLNKFLKLFFFLSRVFNFQFLLENEKEIQILFSIFFLKKIHNNNKQPFKDPQP